MANPDQRERESQESAEDKFHEVTDQEREEREKAAERLAKEDLEKKED